MASVYSYLFTLIHLPVFFFIIINGENSDWFSETKLMLKSEKVTHLHFYYHDTLSGNNPSAKHIAGPELPFFGSTFIADDPLTEGQEQTSRVIGRAQGIYAMAAQKNDPAFIFMYNFVFLQGKYSGSTLSFLGRDAILNQVREFGIVGGTGMFRFARGFAIAKTIWFDTNMDATLEFNVTVIH